MGQPRVLLADDHALLLGAFEKLLAPECDIVGQVSDGRALVAASSKLKPDVIVLDIGMPNMNGYDACRLIRQEPWGKAMFLVALTGWGQEEDRRRTVEAGFDDHMVKPVDIAALIELLASRAKQRSIS